MFIAKRWHLERIKAVFSARHSEDALTGRMMRLVDYKIAQGSQETDRLHRDTVFPRLSLDP